MQGGWIAVYRSLLNTSHDLHPSAVGEEACRMGAWIDLLGMARYEKGGGLKRGELRVTQRELAERWNWSRGKVRRFLNELVENDRLTVSPKPGRQPATLSVCHYDDYQMSQPLTGPNSGPRVNRFPLYGMKEKQGGRTPARDSGKPAGPGDVTVTAEVCPTHDDEFLRRDSRGLYCVVCGDYVDRLEVSA